ncbi:ORF6N domain-containing protein [Dysgonomonas sp. 521]|uniref:ORF6N domain-containing protein n=1 Tax=Dysgonomonas sp. 521 TaxID=2302932 RepID=UPI0013D18CC1|nr:ORF6N domain-containing protein [Dysgonomonas sp. 521]NDV96569.1 ORF6N domain-containing protein [Dysgonomonas sp. 521]
MELSIIQNKIYEIRGYKVMLDFDLAEMYGTETGLLKRAVRRNFERFEGDDFMFEVTKDELSRCQIGILNKGRGSNFKYLPFAFTELGVAMLSSVLNSKTAIEVNRSIMRAFVVVRHLIVAPPVGEIKQLQKELQELKKYIEDVFADYNDINDDNQNAFDEIYIALAELAKKQKSITESKPRKPVGYIKPQNDK